jgi:hypothetical protein
VESDLQMIRHAVATVSYRVAKTLRDVPMDFGAFRASPTSRAPLEIIVHMGDLFDWALSLARGEELWQDSTPRGWAEEVDRLYASIKEFDQGLAGPGTIACPLERLLQGPIADAMTHVGQLAMLRRLSGSPVKGENYYRADITPGRVGPDQAAPRREFD